MHPRRLRWALVAAVVASTLALPATAYADQVTTWNAHTQSAIATAGGVQQAQNAVVTYAIVHAAVYNAVNAIDGGHQAYLGFGGAGAMPWFSQEAAAAAAAYGVLAAMFPTQRPGPTGLDAQYAASLAAITESFEAEGVAVGEAAAQHMNAARANDGRLPPFQGFRFSERFGIGQWRPTPPAFVNDPNAWLKDVMPFAIGDPLDYLSDGPNPVTSAEYAEEFNEVKSLGSAASTERTQDQTDAARYWAANPPANWARTARSISAAHQLTIAENARLFAMLHTAQADALIAVWCDKAEWQNWRPITAIREAGNDGNPATVPDENWTPLSVTPPYPDHSSGASALGGASTVAMESFFGTDKIEWTDTNPIVGITRSYKRLSAAAKEVVHARVWSGIHFRKADRDGVRIGYAVAEFGAQHFFQPVG